MEDPVVRLERNLYGHPFAGLLWERQFEKVSLGTRLGKSSNLRMFIRKPRKGLFLSVYVDDIKLAGSKKALTQCESTHERRDLEDPTSFLDRVYLGCTQRECQTSKDIVDNYRNMFESRISAGGTGKPPCSEKLDASMSSWSYDVEGHAKKMHGTILRTGEQNNSTSTQSRKLLHALTTITLRKKKWDLLESCQKFARKLSSNVCNWHALVDRTLYGP